MAIKIEREGKHFFVKETIAEELFVEMTRQFQLLRDKAESEDRIGEQAINAILTSYSDHAVEQAAKFERALNEHWNFINGTYMGYAFTVTNASVINYAWIPEMGGEIRKAIKEYHESVQPK